MSGLEDLARVRAMRADRPEEFSGLLRTRRRRPFTQGDGRLLIVAADHPARGALAVGADQMAMADREQLLLRLATALSHPGVDGVLGTADIVDDLATMGLLDGKIVVGSVNRGGLQGASFEMDDRVTGYDVPALSAQGLDAAKMLVRIDLADSGTVRTLERAAAVVTEAAAAGMPVMLEPFMSVRVGGRVVNDLSAAAGIRAAAIASGLGASSAYTWLKLPVVPEMARVMAATTLPTLLLGGDLEGESGRLFDEWRRALDLPGVRGLVAGRTLLYPADGDVMKAVDAAARLVHSAP